MTWEEAKLNCDKLINEIKNALELKQPKNIKDVLSAVSKIDKDCGVLPNPNSEGQYCQLILTPSSKWNTWKRISMSISKYNLYS